MQLLRVTSMREGFGNIMADGINRTAHHLGAIEYAQNVIKGQFAIFDPRVTGFLPMHLGMMLHPGRTLGVAAAMGAPSYTPAWPIAEIRKQAERCGVPAGDIESLFTDSEINMGRMTKHGEDFFGLFNMLGQCHRLYISRFYSMNTLAELYSAVTGIKATPGDLKQASANAWTEWRKLNANAGFTRADDYPPDVWFKPLKGPKQDYTLHDYFLKRPLERGEIMDYLDEYYDERSRTAAETPG